MTVLFALLLAAAVHATPTQLHQGEQLYDIHCSSCHGLVLQGSANGPPLIGVPAGDVDFMLETGRMPAQVPWEQEYDKSPQYSSQQIASVVAYVVSKSHGDPVLPVVHVPGDIRHGREIYEENCEHCHAATGRGNAVGYLDVAPPIVDQPPQQIAEAVRMGPDVMPEFGPHVIDERGLDDLITYVQFLQHGQYNPGGLGLANWGPVSEGFIAWVFGIGLLVLLVRRIGTTE